MPGRNLNKQNLELLGRRDSLSWGILNIDLLDGKSWEISTRMWMPEIYQVVNPYEIENSPVGIARRMSVIKPTQVGLSTMAMVRMLHFACNWPVRIMYTLPRQMDTIDFTSTRLDPMIQASQYLKSKLGLPDSTHAKRIGDSFIYIAEMSVETRSIPIDMLLVDEIDLSDQSNVSTAVNRLDASRWKLNYFFSTPTIPGYGIHGIYQNSDMREWLVTCPSCSHEQELDWDKNLAVLGPRNNPTRVFYKCASCGNELTSERIQAGRWVSQRPELSSTHIGFHITQMMTHSATDLYARFIDPQTKLIEFYRKSLGMPYEMGGGSLTRDDILATCFDENYEPEPAWDGRSTYYLGADQGNEIQVLVAKMEPGSRRKKIVHIELIPMESGFDRLAQLIQIFHVRKAVIDGNPNRHSAKSLTTTFPGRAIVADYSEQRETWKSRKDGEVTYVNGVAINRTTGFDAMIKSVKDGEWALPGRPPSLEPDVELFIDHATAIKRDLETRRTASGETQVAVFRKLRADHLAHSLLYLGIAIELDRGRGMKIAVIGPKSDTDHNSGEENEDSAEKEARRARLVSILAEVPASQLVEYMENIKNTDYTPPFPLSYKLTRAEEGGFGHLEILLTIPSVIRSKIPG